MTIRRLADARNTDETPSNLRHMAETLSRLVASLRDTAERMDRAGIRTVNVRCGMGASDAIVKKITPFAQDAAKKASIAGA